LGDSKGATTSPLAPPPILIPGKDIPVKPVTATVPSSVAPHILDRSPSIGADSMEDTYSWDQRGGSNLSASGLPYGPNSTSPSGSPRMRSFGMGSRATGTGAGMSSYSSSSPRLTVPGRNSPSPSTSPRTASFDIFEFEDGEGLHTSVHSSAGKGKPPSVASSKVPGSLSPSRRNINTMHSSPSPSLSISGNKISKKLYDSSKKNDDDEEIVDFDPDLEEEESSGGLNVSSFDESLNVGVGMGVSVEKGGLVTTEYDVVLPNSTSPVVSPQKGKGRLTASTVIAGSLQSIDQYDGGAGDEVEVMEELYEELGSDNSSNSDIYDF